MKKSLSYFVGKDFLKEFIQANKEELIQFMLLWLNIDCVLSLVDPGQWSYREDKSYVSRLKNYNLTLFSSDITMMSNTVDSLI